MFFILVGIIINRGLISSAWLQPARNLAPTVITGGETLEQLWIYISEPLIEFILTSVYFTYLKFEEVR